MKKDSTAYIIFFILSLTLLLGTGVSLVHHLTRDMLAENELMHHNRTLVKAFDLKVRGSSAADYLKTVENKLDVTKIFFENREWEIYTLRDQKPSPVGFVFKGRGIWDIINGIIVLEHDLQKMLSLEFLEQHETPGLGARIEEEWFKEEFKGLKVEWDNQINQRIIIGTTAQPDPENQVDSITGATQTSKALMDSLNQQLDAFKRLIQEHQTLTSD